jgi:hypothetical protein
VALRVEFLLFLAGRCLNEIGNCLPAGSQLRLTLRDVVAKRHIATAGVVHHPLQNGAGYQFLRDARKRSAQPVPLHRRS